MLDTDFRAKAVSIVEFYLDIKLIWFLTRYDSVGKPNCSFFAHHFWGVNRNLTTHFSITHHVCIFWQKSLGCISSEWFSACLVSMPTILPANPKTPVVDIPP